MSIDASGINRRTPSNSTKSATRGSSREQDIPKLTENQRHRNHQPHQQHPHTQRRQQTPSSPPKESLNTPNTANTLNTANTPNTPNTPETVVAVVPAGWRSTAELDAAEAEVEARYNQQMRALRDVAVTPDDERERANRADRLAAVDARARAGWHHGQVDAARAGYARLVEAATAEYFLARVDARTIAVADAAARAAGRVVDTAVYDHYQRAVREENEAASLEPGRRAGQDRPCC